jgi:hypothetical protein
MAERRNINMSGIVEEGRASPDCPDENALASNVSSSSRDRPPSPEEVFVEDLDLTNNTIKWFKSDHLSFYTDWSQMYYSRYDDSQDVFSFFTASGEMTFMVQWFNESRSGFDDSDIIVAKICSCIWKRIHPPSY